LALVCAGALLIAESWLRISVFDPGKCYPRKPGSWGIFRPFDAGTPGVDTDVRITINRHGLRGGPIRRGAAPLWLGVGGSTVEDNRLNDSETWVGRLQARLRTRRPRLWAGNVGKSGTSAIHHALQLEYLLPRLARVETVVVMCGLNDMLYDAGLHLDPYM